MCFELHDLTPNMKKARRLPGPCEQVSLVRSALLTTPGHHSHQAEARQQHSVGLRFWYGINTEAKIGGGLLGAMVEGSASSV